MKLLIFLVGVVGAAVPARRSLVRRRSTDLPWNAARVPVDESHSTAGGIGSYSIDGYHHGSGLVLASEEKRQDQSDSESNAEEVAGVSAHGAQQLSNEDRDHHNPDVDVDENHGVEQNHVGDDDGEPVNGVIPYHLLAGVLENSGDTRGRACPFIMGTFIALGEMARSNMRFRMLIFVHTMWVGILMALCFLWSNMEPLPRIVAVVCVIALAFWHAFTGIFKFIVSVAGWGMFFLEAIFVLSQTAVFAIRRFLQDLRSNAEQTVREGTTIGNEREQSMLDELTVREDRAHVMAFLRTYFGMIWHGTQPPTDRVEHAGYSMDSLRFKIFDIAEYAKQKSDADAMSNSDSLPPCPVCLESLGSPWSQDAVTEEKRKFVNKIIELPCESGVNHRFHYLCAEPWISRHGSCPTCRSTACRPTFINEANEMSVSAYTDF
jgi:hypothetical protein